MAQGRKKINACWLDLFEKPNFQGKLQRHFGPIVLDDFTAASAIVGPETTLEVEIHPSGKRNAVATTRRIKSMVVVKDIRAWAKGMKIRSAKILCNSKDV